MIEKNWGFDITIDLVSIEWREDYETYKFQRAHPNTLWRSKP